jgi:hypothetical protein
MLAVSRKREEVGGGCERGREQGRWLCVQVS